MTTSLAIRRRRAIQNQLRRLDISLERLYRQSARYAQVRLSVFAGGLLFSLAAFFVLGGWIAGLITAGIFLAGFGVAVYVHRRIERNILKFQIWREIKIAQIARMDLDWKAMPPATIGRARAEHPFARDLDLTGERSLHRLMDTAVSQGGSEQLRAWLLDPTPDMAQIVRRQTVVKTLLPLHHFRHKLTMYGMLAATGAGGAWESKRLLEWLRQGSESRLLRPLLAVSWALVPVNLLLFGLYLFASLPAYWVGPFILYAGLQLLLSREAGSTFQEALILQNNLKRLEGVFKHLETFPLPKYPALQSLSAPILQAGQRPSTKLKEISRLVAAAGLVQNPALALILNALLPWNLHVARRLNRYKGEIDRSLPQWLEVWFELEALGSLAGFAYLNPENAFPEIIAATEAQVIFEANALGHPLIPHPERVCNDFSLAGPGSIDLITGSNMSGKSTFLRTVGVNLRLAYAGGPVNATACRLSLLRLFSCLNVSDSVTDGISYFYAEVKRLRALLDELDQDASCPLLYLIDEIFRGTNNRERYLGSQAYIRALAGKSGMGLIATHDLELVKLADELPQLKNYHFRETVANGRMLFDYRLRPGPCPTTNALKIMELEGLPVRH
jgi:hypothetical protein